ncbi:MAG: sigma-70 family RNA polymerase sigma factor [Phycisphaerales bacterium]|nr:sigma-70 family RNA polymerase sigma factor [Phycisphaerales bacterium]MCB9856259.1 sigma-70 family RNA polymerase sigma factor [Phycisphaerales bacterium]MCB9863302.1 sigma-70 family RNA polymerase sigma factor [Phycisphaerales bacterium]
METSERSEFIQRAARGDADALQCLLVDYYAPLLGFIAARMEPPIRRYVDAEDILQDAFADVFRRINECSFEGPAPFYKWLERIAADRLRKTQRDLRRRKRDIRRVAHGDAAGSDGDSSSGYPDFIDRLSSPGTSPSRLLAKREACAAVLSSLARLNDDQRSVIRMRFLEQQSVASVALELDKTEDAIHMLTYRALRKLKPILGSITDHLSRV